MNQIATAATEVLSMTSREIAELTGKQHKDVLRDVRTMCEAIQIEPAQFSAGYKAGNGQEQTEYRLPKDLTLTLVSGYKVAMRKAIIDRWLALETQVIDPLASLPAEHRALIAVMVENAAIKAKQAEQEAVQASQGESIKRLEAKQSAFEDGHSFFTVMGFCAMRGLKLVMADMQRLGKLAAAASKAKGIAIDKVRDARFGMVNSYHESTLQEAFAEIHGGM